MKTSHQKLSFGSIIVVSFPFTDLSDFKKRPAFVLKEYSEDILLCFISSRLDRREMMDISLKKNNNNHLVQNSLLKITKIFTLHKKFFIRKIGAESESYNKMIKMKLVEMIRKFP